MGPLRSRRRISSRHTAFQPGSYLTPEPKPVGNTAPQTKSQIHTEFCLPSTEHVACYFQQVPCLLQTSRLLLITQLKSWLQVSLLQWSWRSELYLDQMTLDSLHSCAAHRLPILAPKGLETRVVDQTGMLSSQRAGISSLSQNLTSFVFEVMSLKRGSGFQKSRQAQFSC